ncbi:MAG: hypothetical protein R3A79_27020 [Nannocystaceae bacterium]
MTRTMAIHLSTPARELVIPRALRLRFATWDGHRGVLPGHEAALALICEGPLHVAALADTPAADARDEAPVDRFLACEEGIATIEPDAVRIAARWAAEAASTEALMALVDQRARLRRRLEEEARALSRRHEIAVQEALSRLKRDPFQ